MANMSHCRFHNTAQDLEDCLEHIQDDLLAAETKARIHLIELCKWILHDVHIDVPMNKQPKFD